jgi:formamidopyrimidine-DNA glycosylase
MGFMPELPEVTTIVRDLRRTVRGKVIAGVSVNTPKLVAPLSVAAFRRRVRGKVFRAFSRRGKFVLAYLGPRGGAPTDVLVWHMRMTGHPLDRDEGHETTRGGRAFRDPRNQHVRFVFRFTDGTRLDYSDVRKFGTIRLVHSRALAEHPSLRILGPDALAHPWTATELCRVLRKHRKTVKQALVDQTIIAGIGNIYADEVLWEARLSPLLRTDALTPRECSRLVRSIRAVLRRSLGARGTSIDDFRDLRGRKGTYGSILRVYARAGQRCFRCGATIAKLRVGGRGTHLCPRCQR